MVKRHMGLLAALSFILGLALLLVACTGPQGPAGEAGSPGVTQEEVKSAIDGRFSTVDKNLPLWGIQPGTAWRMVELTIYFNNMWFGAQWSEPLKLDTLG